MHLSTFVPVYIVKRWILLENLTLNSKAFYQVLSALQGKKNSCMCKLENIWVFHIIGSMVLGSSQHKST